VRTPTSFELARPQPVREVEYVYRNRNGFREAMANKTVVLRTTQTVHRRNRVQTVQEEETVNLYDLWTKSRYRCEFDRLAFTERGEEGSFNIFHGLSVSEADLGRYSAEQAEPWLRHVLEIWCRGDREVFEYVLKRLAFMVQRPFCKSKVAIVLTSRQGAGKGVVMAPIQEIFGKYFKVLKPETVFGEFNDSISDCLVLFLDECTFGGNRKVAAQLKTLITEEKHHINAKYLPAVTLDNHISLFISTNGQWAAPVEESDRRYFVLELDNRYAGKSTAATHAYFKKIRDVPYQAVYKLLMSVDLSGFIPTVYPITEATRTQKLYTMDGVTAWVHQSLGEGSRWTTLPEVSRQDLYADYDAYLRTNGGHYAKREPFSRFLVQLGKICGARHQDGTRCMVAVPPAEDMKQQLRQYLNDDEFPV
jgi:phage/plasmid-associated DNA primase